MDDTILPFFKNGEYSEGIKAGVEKLETLARTELRFLIDEVKIVGLVLIALILISVMTHHLVHNMHDEYMKHQKKCAVFPSIYFGFIYILYLFAILNHIEFWLVFIASFLILLLALLVYAFFYGKTHSLSDTVIHTITVFIMISLMPIYIVVIFSINARGEYGDGSADAGGGATGEW